MKLQARQRKDEEEKLSQVSMTVHQKKPLSNIMHYLQ